MSGVDRTGGPAAPPPSQTRTGSSSDPTDFQREVNIQRQSERGQKRPSKADGDVSRFTEVEDAERLDAARRVKRDKPFGARVRSPFADDEEEQEDDD